MKITYLPENEKLTFSLILIGNADRYFTGFIQAIRFMCRKWFGVDSKPFMLVDIRAVSAMNENRLLAFEMEDSSDKLIYSVRRFLEQAVRIER